LDDFGANSPTDVGSAFRVLALDDSAAHAFGLSQTARTFVLDLETTGAGRDLFTSVVQGFPGESGYYPGVAMSPQGTLVAFGGGSDGTVHNLDTGASAPISAPDFDNFANAWFTGDGKYLVFAGFPMSLVDVATGAVVGHASSIDASSGDGQVLLVEDES